MTKRFRWILVGLVVGLVMGGVAYAVVINPPDSTDRYYACVSPAGVVKAGTTRLNVAPTRCPAATDQVHSWNAVGPTGEIGATGPTGIAPAGDGFGRYVGTYTVTTTNEGCAGNEVRARLVTIDGTSPIHGLGDCTPMKCGTTTLALGAFCTTNGEPFGGIATVSSCVDLAAQLGISDGYFSDRQTLARPGWDDPSTPYDDVQPIVKQVVDGPITPFNLRFAGAIRGFQHDPTGARAAQMVACSNVMGAIKNTFAMPTLADIAVPSTAALFAFSVYQVA